MSKGRFIVIEGLEGAGKSTAIRECESFFKANHLPYLITREPGGTPVGEKLRALFKAQHQDEPLDPRTELLLLYAGRIQHIEYLIKPALAEGKIVLCDRFELSSLAYQVGGRGLPREGYDFLSRYCVNDFKPDLLLYMDIDPRIGLERARGRGELDRIEQESIAFFTRVRQTYLKEISKMDHAVTIDASKPIDEVSADIRTLLKQKL